MLAAADALDDCGEEAVTSVLLSLALLVAMLLDIFRLTPEIAVVIGTSLDGLAEGTVVLAVYDVLLEGSGGACAPEVAVVVDVSFEFAFGTKDGPAEGAAV